MEDRREISWEEGEQFARDNGIDCFSEVSAKTGEKVDAVRTAPPQPQTWRAAAAPRVARRPRL
jgi:hypothetical protein